MKNEKVDYTGTYIVKIDKLQKEIELLQCDLDNANSKLSESIERQLKAIEYIKSHSFNKSNRWGLCMYEIEELLEILRGDKE